MLKVRVIPTLLWRDVGLVKGIRFDSSRRVGPLTPAVRVYTRRDVDELVLLDVRATLDGRQPDLDLITEAADHTTVPLTFGGGITTASQVEAILRAGADKVAINSAAYSRPGLIEECSRRFGAQCIVASIDFTTVAGSVECVGAAGTLRTGQHPIEWAQILEQRGAGEILLTSMERDGTMSGYDLDVLERVVGAVSIPVIASGGAGGPEDMRRAVQDAGASAVAAASIFHFTEQTPAEMKEYLGQRGVPIRR